MAMRVAIPSGRIQEASIEWLESQGFVFGERSERALRVTDESRGWEAVAVKPADIPWLVGKGIVDFGLVGGDVLREGVYPVAVGPSLGIGCCRMVLAGTKGSPWPPAEGSRVATKYPRQARAFLARRGIEAEVVPLKGSVEIAPLIGLAPYIVDLVQTGRTLRENGLVEFEEVAKLETLLVASPKALEQKAEARAFWQGVIEERGMDGADVVAR